MKRSRLGLIVAAAGPLWGAPAHAYRPFDGTDAEVASPRELELEVGPIGYLRAGRARSIVSPALVVNYGFLPRWEAVLEGRNELPTNAQGVGSARLTDTALSVKVVVREGTLQGSSGLSVAIEPGILLPETEAGVTFGFSTGVIVSYRSATGTLHVNLAGARSQEGEWRGFASVILEGPDVWPVRPVMELADGWQFNERWPSAAEHTVLFGAIAPLNERWSIDGGFRVGRENDMPSGEVRVGFTWGVDFGGSGPRLGHARGTRGSVF